ncbi:MAG TPA: maleylpyruvate isomerase N-terminal domain-containing protein [Actinomycetota bacterium]|jgi:hypothetical protein
MDRRDELATREAESWRAFLSEIQAVPSDRREDEGVVPGWSVKDLVSHCGGWARFSADQLQAIGNGTFTDPFDGVPDEHWDRVSQEMIEESRRTSFEEVLRGAEEARARARSVWSALPTVSDEATHFFSEETYEHYDEHRAEIQAFRERGRERG